LYDKSDSHANALERFAKPIAVVHNVTVYRFRSTHPTCCQCCFPDIIKAPWQGAFPSQGHRDDRFENFRRSSGVIAARLQALRILVSNLPPTQFTLAADKTTGARS
jgi:hypothetical protein